MRKRIIDKRVVGACFVSMALLALAACGGTHQPGTEHRAENPHADVAKPHLDVDAVARQIVNRVGNVQKTSSAGDRGPVFVFEEFHTSRVGQLQIAAMLVRLHDSFGMKIIGLEGKISAARPIDASSYRLAGGEEAKADREDLAVRMVGEGEISSAEAMAMLFPDVEVYGTESAEQYSQTLDVKGSPQIEYLIAIAERSISPQQAEEVMKLIKRERKDDALQLMLNSDPWVKEHYEAVKSGAASSEQMIASIREVQAKADQVGAEVRPGAKADLEKVLKFFQTASERSATMVDKTLELVSRASGPVVMIIGAAHADRVTELLAQRNASFVLIRPIDLNPSYGSLTVEQYDRKASGGWARNSPGTLGYVLNQRRKPPPVIERASGVSYASMNLAGMIVAKAARSGGRIPDDIWPRISNLPGIRIDKTSFSVDGYDVIFRGWLKDDNGQEKEVWARVGTASVTTGPISLQDKFIDAAETLAGRGGGGHKPPHTGGSNVDNTGGNDNEPGDVPRGARPAENEGPKDARKGDVIISRTSRETLAVFASDREEVKRVGRISI
jgi:hypothetical protein